MSCRPETSVAADRDMASAPWRKPEVDLSRCGGFAERAKFGAMMSWSVIDKIAKPES
jgi:hypothetical protein